MDWSFFITFLFMALIIEVTPGPNFLLITKTVPTAGRSAALANISGFAAAFVVHGVFSIYGVSFALASSEILFFFVKLLGAGYLIFLGVQAVVEASPCLIDSSVMGCLVPSNDTDSAKQSWSRIAGSRILPNIELSILQVPMKRQTLSRAWREGFVTNCLNPKISLFYLAAFPQFIQTGNESAIDSLLLVATHIMVNGLWFIAVTLGVERLLKGDRSVKYVPHLKLASGLALIGFGATFAISAFA